MKRATILAATFGVTAVAALGAIPAPSIAGGSLPMLRLTLDAGRSVTADGSVASGAVDVVTTVTGEPAGEPALFLLKPGVTAAKLFKVVAALGNAPLDAIDPYATIVFDAEAPSGTSSAQTVLEPGHYLVADLDSPKPVGTTITVASNSHPATLPQPTATVSAIDFAFRGPTTLRDGELVRFVNRGYLIHMFAWGSTSSLAVAKRAEALLSAGQGQAAAKLATDKGMFAGPVSSGQMQQEVISDPPGIYVLYCGMDTQDGREHYQLGMFRTIRIVK